MTLCNITSEMLFVIYRSLECTHVQGIHLAQNDSQDPILPSNVDVHFNHKSESKNIEQERDNNK